MMIRHNVISVAGHDERFLQGNKIVLEVGVMKDWMSKTVLLVVQLVRIPQLASRCGQNRSSREGSETFGINTDFHSSIRDSSCR